MLSKLAVLALLLLSMAAVGERWVSSASAHTSAGEGVGSRAPHLPSAERARAQHVLWNGAAWLLGLGLAVSLGRERARQLRPARAADGCSALRARQKAA
jgi:hypothetical protein